MWNIVCVAFEKLFYFCLCVSLDMFKINVYHLLKQPTRGEGVCVSVSTYTRTLGKEAKTAYFYAVPRNF